MKANIKQREFEKEVQSTTAFILQIK